jgi:hypothetical protein
LLGKFMPAGRVLPECAVSTADGIKGVEVAWASPERWAEVGNLACFIQSPELCVEILSPSNSDEEITEKTALYFEAGAKEVWICGIFGAMTFFGPGSSPLARSELCPNFPTEV